MTVRWAPAAHLMAGWRPGSYDTHADFHADNPGDARRRHGDYDPAEMPWTWEDELVDIDRRGELVPILFSVRLLGVLAPVLLGDDGRVWGGHHRIIAAHLAGEPVPYETAGDDVTVVDRDGNWAHGVTGLREIVDGRLALAQLALSGGRHSPCGEQPRDESGA